MKYVLVLGAGGMGRRHIKALGKINDVRIVCYDTNAKLCQDLLDNHLIFAHYTDLSKIPAADIFCAVIATPSNTHIDYCNWCLALNIPFLVEKPLSNSLDGINGLIAEVNKKKLIAGVAYPRRSSFKRFDG
jgi:predicted dehydrogenase